MSESELLRKIDSQWSPNRRQWLGSCAAGALASSAVKSALAAEPEILGKADSCIFLWLGGGAAQIDTFDPKKKGDLKKTPGAAYDSIETAISGVRLCEHLPRTATLLDRCVPIRTLHHKVIDEHGIATNIVHTGRPTSETIVYPSIGSIVANQLGPRSENVPAYVLIGYPNISRGPGFLGSKAGYVYLTDTKSGPAGLAPPADLSADRRARRDALLARYQSNALAGAKGETSLADYVAAARISQRLAGEDFGKVFRLETEPADLRESYGGEFGQRCLLARRLVEAGVRFVEVSHNLNFINGTGWDTHNDGQKKQHILIRELDNALAGLIEDLQRRGRLDKTLIALGTEFGRPAEFDSGGGRGHQSTAFSVILAGGGLRTGQIVGTTDDLAKKIVDEPVSVPDYHATILAALGISSRIELKAGERPVPITEGGRPIRKLFDT
ncbi:DUF1501 domain-containing protein [bacterium]|nr:DUF1501 domain-containing protein [bacterium]